MTVPSTPETADSASPNLLDRIRVREPAGWQQFVKLYTPLVYYWCRKAGLPAIEAADVSQAVFRSVLSHVAEYQHNSPGDTLRGWLFAVTRKKLADHYRKSKASDEGARSNESSKVSESSRIGSRSGDIAKSGDNLLRQFQLQADAALPEKDKGPADPAIANLIQRALQRVQSRFEAPVWQAFWRVTVDGHSPADVATDLNISTNAVYKAKSQVLNRLRDELGDRLG